MLRSSANYVLSTSGVLIVMISLLAWRTDGFSNYTYESARRSGIENSPVQVSDWRLENTRQEIAPLSAYQDGLLFVDFIYTRCPTICRSLGSRYSQLQALIEQNPSANIKLLSISIDPKFDTPQKLVLYREAHKGKAKSWELARPTDQSTLLEIMEQTGLRVIPDEFGGYAHSDSIHVIENGLLIKIKDWDSVDLDNLILNASIAQQWRTD